MNYETAIELYSEGIISYEEAVMEMEDNYSYQIDICPFDIHKEELEKLIRAKGLLEELRFNKMYKD